MTRLVIDQKGVKRGDVSYPLAEKDESLSELTALHVLQYFSHAQAYNVLKNWVSKLKPGGWLKIAVPDFKKCIEPYNRGQKTKMADWIMGGQEDEYDYHKSLFDNQSLTALMNAVGLVDLQLWESETNDDAALPISLNIMGQKPFGSNIKKPGPRVTAVMSMPRLCFSDNMACAITQLGPLGIQIKQGVGVWWEQCLTRMIETIIEDGYEFVLTLDYDTWFRSDHVIKLIQLMEKYTEADALVPVMQRREEDSMLIAVDGPANQRETLVPYDNFKQPLMAIGTGHFGLTLFRVSALKKLKKPWFLPVPGPDKSWNEGRQDPDIYFWNQFKQQGLRAYQANEVKVGHMQIMCTFPDRFPSQPGEVQKSVHMYMGDLKKNGPPIHCVPNVDHLG